MRGRHLTFTLFPYTTLFRSKVQGIDAAIDGSNLTALVFPGSSEAGIAAKAGYPSVIVPAGYLSTSMPYGIMFTGKADRKSTRLNSSHRTISYAVFCLKKKTK